MLLHWRADKVWGVDFQLGGDADPQSEREPQRVLVGVRALLGAPAQFEWVGASVYAFSSLTMEAFRHGRVFFAGDSAHGVSPFGARGGNFGVQDAENLAWNLRYVVRSHAPDALHDSYRDEREFAADENIRNSTGSTDFITPKSELSWQFRDATLERDCAFSQPLVNSGRLSRPSTYASSPLNAPDEDELAGVAVPGAPLPDAPLRDAGWLLRLTGDEFILLCFSGAGIPSCDPAPIKVVVGEDDGLAAERLGAPAGGVYLVRPDQHVAARRRRFDAAKVAACRCTTPCCRTAPTATPSRRPVTLN